MPTPSGTVKHFGQLAVFSGFLLLTGLVCPAPGRSADLSLPITGNVLGSVVDAAGIPQMGATVVLLNKYQQTVAKVSSDVNGHFLFASLPTDLYSLRASLPTFLPVSRERIAVRAGSDSVLQVHLATLVSSVEVSYIVPAAAMSEDWKWALRTSAATRPISRYLPDDLGTQTNPDEDDPNGDEILAERRPVFSETRALLSVTGGDGGPLDSDSSFSDFGTAFALSTQVYGKNYLQVSGSVGDSNLSTSPAIGLSAVYSRNNDASFGRPPEITLTAMQVAGIGMIGPAAMTGSAPNTAIPLRSMSLSLYQTIDPVSNLHLEYGVSGESVDFGRYSARLSPFARLTLDGGKRGDVIAAFSDGGRPDQLLRHGASNGSDNQLLDPDLTSSVGSLQRFPQISNRDRRLVLQRTQSYEMGYVRTAGSRTYAISGFAENVTNGRLSIAGNVPDELAADVLSDNLSRTSVYNVGRYHRSGYLASATQRIGQRVEFGTAYGRMGAFSAGALGGVNPFLQQRTANFASARVRTVLPHLGTRIDADYGWIDSGTVVPRHIFVTQGSSAAPGLNIYLRQPVPTILGLPGRLELTADLRNLLSQGYLPVGATADNRQMLIVQAPQSVRGGLNFTF